VKKMIKKKFIFQIMTHSHTSSITYHYYYICSSFGKNTKSTWHDILHDCCIYLFSDHLLLICTGFYFLINIYYLSCGYPFCILDEVEHIIMFFIKINGTFSFGQNGINPSHLILKKLLKLYETHTRKTLKIRQ
jgi:hypothetical protein